MGAWSTQRAASGKNAREAWNNAQRDAQDEVGHQEGYSGDVNSGGYGFIMVDLPKRCSLDKFIGMLEDFEMCDTQYARDDVRNWSPGGFFNQSGKVRGAKGRLAKAKRELAQAQKRAERLAKKVEAAGFDMYTFERLAAQYNDKWGDYLCVKLSAHLAKKNYPYLAKRRGESVYVFFGYAPC